MLILSTRHYGYVRRELLQITEDLFGIGFRHVVVEQEHPHVTIVDALQQLRCGDNLSRCGASVSVEALAKPRAPFPRASNDDDAVPRHDLRLVDVTRADDCKTRATLEAIVTV